MIRLPNFDSAIAMMDRWQENRITALGVLTFTEDYHRNIEWNSPIAFLSIPDDDNGRYARDPLP